VSEPENDAPEPETPGDPPTTEHPEAQPDGPEIQPEEPAGPRVPTWTVHVGGAEDRRVTVSASPGEVSVAVGFSFGTVELELTADTLDTLVEALRAARQSSFG
jgi:hypothetical protein